MFLANIMVYALAADISIINYKFPAANMDFISALRERGVPEENLTKMEEDKVCYLSRF